MNVSFTLLTLCTQRQKISFQRFIIIAIAMIAIFSGCGYGKVSPKTYEIAQALYGICNRRQVEKIPQATELISTSLQQEEITEQEAGWLQEIVSQAEQGEWEKAAQESRRILADQTKMAR